MATTPTYEGAVIADAISYRGQVQIIGGTANVSNPPYVITTPNGNTPSVDAFGRQRVSLSNSLFDSKFRFDLLPALYDQTVTGTGSITYQTNEKCARLAVTGAGIGRALMRSHQTFLYRAAQSMQIDISFCSGAIAANTVKRYGYFDDNNGMFFEVALFRNYSGAAFAFTNCGTATAFSTTVVTTPTDPAVLGSGYIVASGFVGAAAGNQISANVENPQTGLLTVTGTDLYVIRAYGLSGAGSGHFVMNFQEVY